MGHGPEHHIEHAEHDAHAAHDPQERKIAMTITVVAALLAVVSLLGHREHTATLQHQIQAGMKRTEAANAFARYQSKSIRRAQYELEIKKLPLIAQPEKAADAEKLRKELAAEVARYKMPADQEKDADQPEELAGIMQLGKRLNAEADKLQAEAEHAHHRADRFDLGELFVEFALVLCSVAVLTKRKPFWFTGIGFCAVGAAVAASGLFNLFMH